MFGIWRKKKPVVYSHWYTLFSDFESSPSQFYESILKELQRREIPGLESKRINFFEGGFLTQRRSYLRMRRERIVYDVCSAPFGTAWFFSCRVAEIPFVLRLWELVILAGILFGMFLLYPLVFGVFWGSVVFGASVVGALVLLNTFAATATVSLDSILLKIPVLGTLYELFVRRNQTYYREDTRAMYSHIVNAVVIEQLDQLAAEHGIEKVDRHNVSNPVSPPTFLEMLAGAFAGR